MKHEAQCISCCHVKINMKLKIMESGSHTRPPGEALNSFNLNYKFLSQDFNFVIALALIKKKRYKCFFVRPFLSQEVRR